MRKTKTIYIFSYSAIWLNLQSLLGAPSLNVYLFVLVSQYLQTVSNENKANEIQFKQKTVPASPSTWRHTQTVRSATPSMRRRSRFWKWEISIDECLFSHLLHRRTLWSLQWSSRQHTSWLQLAPSSWSSPSSATVAPSKSPASSSLPMASFWSSYSFFRFVFFRFSVELSLPLCTLCNYELPSDCCHPAVHFVQAPSRPPHQSFPEGDCPSLRGLFLPILRDAFISFGGWGKVENTEEDKQCLENVLFFWWICSTNFVVLFNLSLAYFPWRRYTFITHCLCLRRSNWCFCLTKHMSDGHNCPA